MEGLFLFLFPFTHSSATQVFTMPQRSQGLLLSSQYPKAFILQRENVLAKLLLLHRSTYFPPMSLHPWGRLPPCPWPSSWTLVKTGLWVGMDIPCLGGTEVLYFHSTPLLVFSNLLKYLTKLLIRWLLSSTWLISCLSLEILSFP